MLVIIITSCSLGESMTVPEPEKLFSYPMVGTCEDGGHACVGLLGGCGHLFSQSLPKPSCFSHAGTRRARGQTAGAVTVGETEVRDPFFPTMASLRDTQEPTSCLACPGWLASPQCLPRPCRTALCSQAAMGRAQRPPASRAQAGMGRPGCCSATLPQFPFRQEQEGCSWSLFDSGSD